MRQLFLELAKAFEGFPSCSRLHCAPAFLQLYPESKDQNREVKRINGLSVFVKEIEPKFEHKEISQNKTDKSRYKKLKLNKNKIQNINLLNTF